MATNNPPKTKKKFTCPICLELIVDATPKTPGQDAVYCDGLCQTWIHRQCAGLSKPAFNQISQPTNNNPFFCPNCRLDQQAKEINSLKSIISSLTSEVANLKRSSPLGNHLTYSKATSTGVSTPSSDAPSSTSPSTHSTHSHSTPGPHNKQPGPVITAEDRKYNIVVYGIEECEKE